MKHLFFISLLFIAISCKHQQQKNGEQKEMVVDNSYFNDENILKIASFQNDRNVAAIALYLKNELPEYRRVALIAMASVQNTSALHDISALLDDEFEEVREAAAFALGQLRDSTAEAALITAYLRERTPLVKSAILEAIGKCGTLTGLSFVADKNFTSDDIMLLSGQAWGLNRFAMRKITNTQSTAKALELIQPLMPEKVRYIASNYFHRGRNLELSQYTTKLIEAYDAEGYVYTKMNLVSAIRQPDNDTSYFFLDKLLTTDNDYRIIVNGIDAFSAFGYTRSKESIFKLLKHSNKNIAIKASEFFIKYGVPLDAMRYFKEAKEVINWRVRANMCFAALKNADTNQEINKYVIAQYQNSSNIYEKAFLLTALSGNVANYKFIENEIFTNESPIISTYGMEALVTIRKSDQFKRLQIKDRKIDVYFAELFKRGVQSGDVALMGISAAVIGDSQLNISSSYSNSYFLTQALKKCRVPEQIEAYLELQKTVNLVNGTNMQLSRIKNKPINRELLLQTPLNQRVKVTTTKGDFVIELKAATVPATVQNFLDLVKRGYYNGLTFHRVVPNFVVQVGCKRGDGWGGESYTIASEFGMTYYEEGSVGMASAGKDTESTQWFVVHYPTAHLDGNYTNFGNVVRGMSVVHNLEIGDKILNITLVDDSEQLSDLSVVPVKN